jgi:hypothetical protein
MTCLQELIEFLAGQDAMRQGQGEDGSLRVQIGTGGWCPFELADHQRLVGIILHGIPSTQFRHQNQERQSQAIIRPGDAIGEFLFHDLILWQ